MDSLGFFQIVKILSESVVFSRNLVRFFHISSDSSKFSLILLEFCRIPSYSLVFYAIFLVFFWIVCVFFQIFSNYFRIHSDSFEFFKILSDSVIFSRFSLIVLESMEFSRLFFRILWNFFRFFEFFAFFALFRFLACFEFLSFLRFFWILSYSLGFFRIPRLSFGFFRNFSDLHEICILSYFFRIFPIPLRLSQNLVEFYHIIIIWPDYFLVVFRILSDFLGFLGFFQVFQASFTFSWILMDFFGFF